MNVWIRRLALGFAGLLVLVVALAAWFIASFDANRYKGVAIEWMKTHRHRTLAIDGPVQLSVFPRLAVKLSKVSLSEAGRPDTFAALDKAGLAVEVLPLLRGQLVVGRIDAEGVRLAYRRNAKGESNIDDLMQSEPEGQAASARKPLRFDVSGIALTDVQVQVQDQARHLDGTLALQRFEAGHLANGVEAPVKLDARLDFKQPAIKGTLAGQTHLKLDTDSGSAAVRDMDLRFQGDAPGASALDARAKGSVAWDGEKKSVEAQSLALTLSGHTGALKHEGSTLQIDRFAFDPERKALTLRKLQARVKGQQGSEPVAVDLDWPELAVEGDKLSGSAFSGHVSRGGEMALQASFKSAAPSGSFDAVKLPGFEARIQGKSAARQIDGTLHSELLLKPTPFALTLDKLDLQAKIDEPKQPSLALGARGNAFVSMQRSNWNLQGQLNDNRFASDGTAILAGDTPQINAKAHFDALDLNRLMGPSTPAAKPATAPGADTPVDLSGLRAVYGQFSLSAGHFAYQTYRVDDARIDAALDGGMLRVTTLQGRAWGGQLQASAFADARASRIASKGTASGVNVNALLKDVAGKDWLEGTGRVNWDIDTAGRSVNEMKSRLKGTAALQVRDGAIKGINLAKTLRQAKAALAMKQDAAQKASQTEKTDFSELSASFQIADGVARNRDLDMKSPFLRLGGEGAIDIGHGRIDYLARASVVAAPKGQDAGDLGALKGLTVPVRLSGPFESLDWKIQWSSVAAGMVTQQIQNKLGEALGIKPPAGGASQPSTQDSLKKALKGLFK